MRHLLSTSFVLLATTASLSACGSLDTKTDTSPPLASIAGDLVNPDSVTVSGNVRVAVVWKASGSQGTFNVNVADDLPVQPVFPASFTVTLSQPPPTSSFTDGDEIFGSNDRPTTPTSPPGTGSAPGSLANGSLSPQGEPTVEPAVPSFQVAVGSVVAYLDENGNGKLDLVAPGASGYVDQILATDPRLTVVFAQGTVPADVGDGAGNVPAPGYNLHRSCPQTTTPEVSSSAGSICTAAPDAGAPTPTCSPAWQSIDTPIELTISTDPEVDTLMCSTYLQTGEIPDITPQPGRPTTYPSPCDPQLSCATDGSSYNYASEVTVPQGLCKGDITEFSFVSYQRPSPVPTDWPCKAD